jgi:hypothetical protein
MLNKTAHHHEDKMKSANKKVVMKRMKLAANAVERKWK